MKVYLSSTFTDLEDYRKAAGAALRNLGLHVIGMEDYVAADERPLQTCLKDVAGCELYVGILAFRYGFVPTDANPDQLSITELEYREAGNLKKPRLMFVVPPDAAWPRCYDDEITKENGAGELIATLRDKVLEQHGTMHFTSALELAGKVAASASRRILDSYGVDLSAPARAPLATVRELDDVLLLHMPADDVRARSIAADLRGVWRVRTTSTALLADSPAQLAQLDREALGARGAVVLLSNPAMAALREEPVRTRRMLSLVRHRTGSLIGFDPVGADPAALPEQVRSQFDEVIRPAGGDLKQAVHKGLLSWVRRSRQPERGLPLMVVAMTGAEAEELFAAPPEQVAALLRTTGDGGAAIRARYGPRRRDWQPFGAGSGAIDDLLARRIERLNAESNDQRGLHIRPQHYIFDELVDDSFALSAAHEAAASAGGLVVLDELSLFLPRIRESWADSPFSCAARVSMVSIAPVDPMTSAPYDSIRADLDGYLADAVNRYGGDRFDPLCEVGVPERLRLDRWLHGNVPRLLSGLREAPRDDAKVMRLATELGQLPDPAMTRLISGETRS